jgi:hypothetical protein
LYGNNRKQYVRADFGLVVMIDTQDILMKRAEIGLLEVLGLVVNAGRGECVVGS